MSTHCRTVFNNLYLACGMGIVLTICCNRYKREFFNFYFVTLKYVQYLILSGCIIFFLLLLQFTQECCDSDKRFNANITKIIVYKTR